MERLRLWRQASIDDLKTAEEFLRRFLLHTLPRGFVRIRFFGFLPHRRRAVLLPLCRQLLGAKAQPGLAPETTQADKPPT